MDCINNIIDCFCEFDLSDSKFNLVTNTLSERIVEVAYFFGFCNLCNELKLKIHICNELYFNRMKEKYCLNKNKYTIAFSCDINHIYVLDYNLICRAWKLNAYEAVIVHETVHVFHRYFSQLPPYEYVWLYESVACYLAKQENIYNFDKDILWNTFIKDFYSIKDCYNLAYIYGKAIFNEYGHEIYEVIKIPIKYENTLKEIFNSLFI